MSLLSVGRNAEATSQLVEATRDLTPEQKKKFEDARKGLLDTLTPWIPGDFVVSYGILLTSWAGMRRSFGWLLLVAGISAVAFVFLGAFAATGFKTKRSRRWNGLAVRAIVGALVSVYAAVAIPNSGWYDFKWFTDNELSVVVTAGIVVVFLVLALKGIQKRTGMKLS